MTPDRVQTLSLIETLHVACTDYSKLPEKSRSNSGHTQLIYLAKEKEIKDTLAHILDLFNRQAPKHWPKLHLQAIFNLNRVVTFRYGHTYGQKDYEEYEDDCKGVPIEGPRLARLMGIFYGALDTLEKTPEPKMLSFWNKIGLPESFDTPAPFLFLGQTGRVLIKALNFHDLLAQALISFEDSCFATLATSSRRKNLEESFQDGLNWHAKNFYKYKKSCWTAGPYFMDKIKRTKLIPQKVLTNMGESVYQSQLDEIFLSIVKLLEQVNTAAEKTEYGVFASATFKPNQGHRYQAHDARHALAQALCDNIKLFSHPALSQKAKPENWSVFSMNAVENPL